jgi:hypothetical protein
VTIQRSAASSALVISRLAAACVLLGTLACQDLRNEKTGGIDPMRADSGTDTRPGIDAPAASDAGGDAAGADGNENAGADAPGAADAGSDLDVCSPGETRCADTGAAVLVCASDQRWMPRETCPSICRAGACAGLCAPGQRHCGADQTPETCSAGGEWTSAGQPCPFVCQGQGQCAGDCRPGGRRCAGAGQLTPETCDQTGKWVAESPCANVCSSGSCGGSCRPGTRRCGANRTPETCSPAGTWEPGQACSYVCTAEGDCTGECRPAQRRCSGTVEQLCSEAGLWMATSSASCRKPAGEACGRDGDCASGFCAELAAGTGVCCSAACNGACESCRNTATGKPDGTCAPVRNGTDPDNDCAAESPASCGRDGACDGNRHCRLHPRDTVCEEARCASNQRARLSQRSCDGSGRCGDATSTSCSPIQRCEGSGTSAHCASQCATVGGPCCDGGVCDRAASGRQLYCVGSPVDGSTGCEACGRSGERCCPDESARCEPGSRCLLDIRIPSCAECGKRGQPCCPGVGLDQPCGDGSVCRGPRGFCGT